MDAKFFCSFVGLRHYPTLEKKRSFMQQWSKVGTLKYHSLTLQSQFYTEFNVMTKF